MAMRPGRDNRLGNVLCPCTHARRLVGARCPGSTCMPQSDPCRQLWVPECLAEADSYRCRCGTEESWKEPRGYMESACKFSPSGILHVYLHFCQDLLPRKIDFWSSQIWEKRMILSMQCWIQELSVHTHDAVRGSLWATSQSTRDMLHYKTAGNFFLWRTQRIWWKLDNVQECLVKPSSFPANYQLPSLKSWCLLECIHCRRERILRLCDHYLLVAWTMEKYIG